MPVRILKLYRNHALCKVGSVRESFTYAEIAQGMLGKKVISGKDETMQNRKEIVMINVANIYPHPDNPRKDVGDVTELAESIKKQGVMQNLTVIPLSALTEELEEQPDADTESLSSDFHVIIGHRRLAAAKLAVYRDGSLQDC